MFKVPVRGAAILAVVATLLTVPSVTHSETVSFVSSLEPGQLWIEEHLGRISVQVDDPRYRTLQQTGAPELPYRIVRVLLPPGERLVSFDVDDGRPVLVRSDVVAQVAGPVVSEDGTMGIAPAPGGAFTPGDGAFPGSHVRYLGMGYLHGRGIASFAVLPLRIDGGNLWLAGDIEVRVVTEPTIEVPTVARDRYREGFKAELERILSPLVVNPAINDRYPPGVRVESRGGGFQPTPAPSLEGSAVDYVIITTAALASEYQRLADWKTAKGVPTVVRTVEWIVANTKNGVDLQETLRFFIQDAYSKWGVSYVLLGGDTDVLPARYVWSGYGSASGRQVPADMYFGCLDGSWNDDHDGKWGEVPADNPDLYAEVYTGRLPISDLSSVANAIDKVIEYESAATADYLDKYLILAEVLVPSAWTEGDSIIIDGAGMAQNLINLALSGSPLRLNRMYETHSLYPGSAPENKAAALDSLNSGYNFVTHLGHGYRFNMSVGDASILNIDADTLSNDGQWFNLYMLNCTAAAYDFFCLGEHFLQNPVGGAVSVVGANESAYPTAAWNYMREYNELVFVHDVVHIGEAFARSRLPQSALAGMSDNIETWTHYIYSLLADPEMTFHTGPVATLDVTHPVVAVIGPNTISINVSSGGMPVDSAVVCLWKGDDDYVVTTTDPLGQATVGFTAESPGSIGVVVTGLNAQRHQSYITVNPSAGTYINIAGLTIDDDGFGGTTGNGDGKIDAGETVDFYFDLINSGGTKSKLLSVVLRSSDPSVTLVDSTAGAPRLDPGATGSTSDPTRVTFNSTIPDEAALDFSIEVKNGGEHFTDRFVAVAHAPRLELRTIRIDDSGGNGDGIVDAGEQFRLYCAIKNFGTGAATSLSASATDLSGNFLVLQGADSYPDLPSMGSSENTAGFQLVETTTSGENALYLLISDGFGRVCEDTLELRPPSPPGPLSFDPSLGPDRLQVTWEQSSSGDVNRYIVYRSETPGGPYLQANEDPVEHAVYLDTGLDPITRYYYVIAAVDASGNESAVGSEYSASTNPPNMPGFPIGLPTPTTSDPVVGDIDGDGDMEIVVGNEFVCAWHHDGQELLDGDTNAQSWGPINALGDGFTAGIALAILDENPGLDIIACDLTTKSVYCMDHQGNLLPGWPRTAGDKFRAAPVAGDVDGDGDNEIIAVDVTGVVYVWHHNGIELRDGDGDPLSDGVFFVPPATASHYGSPALCDLDGDNIKEIVLGTRSGSVYALNEDGTSVPGWPFVLASEMAGSVVAGDVDGDGMPEVVARAVSAEVYLINHDGSLAPGWPRWVSINQPFFRPSPALADLTGDGRLEIVLAFFSGSLARVHVLDYQGNDLPGWPIVYSTESFTECTPVVADVDGDGNLDIMIGDESRLLHAWSSSGNVIDGFPIATGDAIRATPYAGDVDQDGDIDMVVYSWDQNIYVYDLGAPYDPVLAPWPTFQGNASRDGMSPAPDPTGIGGGAGPAITEMRLFQNQPNPFNPTTRIAYLVPGGVSRPVSLVVYGLTGARVRTLVRGVEPPGRHEVLWDGRDERGNRVGSGVYFYRLEVDGRSVAKKMVFLK